MSITRLPAAEYFAAIGAQSGPVTPPPPVDEPDPAPDYATREEYEALLDRVTALEQAQAAHTHPHTHAVTVAVQEA